MSSFQPFKCKTWWTSFPSTTVALSHKIYESLKKFIVGTQQNVNKFKGFYYSVKTVMFLSPKGPTLGLSNALSPGLKWCTYLSCLNNLTSPCGGSCQRYTAQRKDTSVSVFGLTGIDRPEVWQAAVFDRISYFRKNWTWHLLSSQDPRKLCFFLCVWQLTSLSYVGVLIDT